MTVHLLPKWFPWLAMAVWPVILVKRGHRLSECTLNHERIHHQQQKEMLLIFFYIWYVAEWSIRMIQYRGHWMKAYRAISFEAEAFEWEAAPDYLEQRKRWAWWKYLG